MYRNEKILMVILIAVFGLILPLGYHYVINHPIQPDSTGLKISSATEQHAAVLTAFVIKPIYMLVSFLIVILLWQRKRLVLKTLKWAMLSFFIGESFCAANYLFTDNHDAYLLEYFHGLGMVLSFGFAAYALFEWLDLYVLHFSDFEKKCSLAGFCRQCIKYEAVSCGLKSLFVYLALVGAIVALMPLTAGIHSVSYTTEIWGTPYNYHHPVIYQLAEVRYYPVLASAMFLLGAFILKYKHHNPLQSSKIFLAGAVGVFGFSMFRFLVFQGYRDNLVWMDFWEEISEFLYVAGVTVILWYFRRALFEGWPKGKN